MKGSFEQSGNDDRQDELLGRVQEIAEGGGKISIPLLQRMLAVDSPRAARLIELWEKKKERAPEENQARQEIEKIIKVAKERVKREQQYANSQIISLGSDPQVLDTINRELVTSIEQADERFLKSQGLVTPSLLIKDGSTVETRKVSPTNRSYTSRAVDGRIVEDKIEGSSSASEEGYEEIVRLSPLEKRRRESLKGALAEVLAKKPKKRKK